MFDRLRAKAVESAAQIDIAPVSGRVLILDGDFAAYRVAAQVKTLPTAIRRFQKTVLTEMFMAKATSARVHLTPTGGAKNNRHLIKAAKPYQDNRVGTVKPPLVDPLRDILGDPAYHLPEFEVFRHLDIEADDACMIDSYNLGENGVLRSDDKDLRATTQPFYENREDVVKPGQPWGTVFPYVTPGGQFTLLGQGPIFLWAQMLMGDTADNIQGLLRYDGNLIGPKRTWDLFQSWGKDTECPDFVVNQVFDMYRAIDQNPWPEGWLLHILRSRDDDFNKLVNEFDISPSNLSFLDECWERDWIAGETDAET